MNKNKTQTLIRYFWLLGMLARDFRGLAFQTFNIHVMHVPRCTLLVHPFEMHAILFKRWSSDVFWDWVERDGRMREGKVATRISLKRSTLKISSWAIIFWMKRRHQFIFEWLSTTTKKPVSTHRTFWYGVKLTQISFNCTNGIFSFSRSSFVSFSF